MNQQKKLELLSNALAAETKVLLAANFSCEEIAVGQKILIKNAQKATIILLIQSLFQLSPQVGYRRLIYKSFKLVWMLIKTQSEISALLHKSLYKVEEHSGSRLDVTSPLSLSTALSMLINQEILTFLIR